MVVMLVLRVVPVLVILGCLHKSKELRARRTSLEAGLARCLVFDDDDCDAESLVAE